MTRLTNNLIQMLSTAAIVALLVAGKADANEGWANVEPFPTDQEMYVACGDTPKRIMPAIDKVVNEPEVQEMLASDNLLSPDVVGVGIALSIISIGNDAGITDRCEAIANFEVRLLKDSFFD
ncbi:MAG: hypothetical protein II336_05630 [Loktanella sp.]|nr:hypothetical protein [Loktanella sp.]